MSQDLIAGEVICLLFFQYLEVLNYWCCLLRFPLVLIAVLEFVERIFRQLFSLFVVSENHRAVICSRFPCFNFLFAALYYNVIGMLFKIFSTSFGKKLGLPLDLY